MNGEQIFKNLYAYLEFHDLRTGTVNIPSVEYGQVRAYLGQSYALRILPDRVGFSLTFINAGVSRTLTVQPGGRRIPERFNRRATTAEGVLLEAATDHAAMGGAFPWTLRIHPEDAAEYQLSTGMRYVSIYGPVTVAIDRYAFQGTRTEYTATPIVPRSPEPEMDGAQLLQRISQLFQLYRLRGGGSTIRLSSVQFDCVHQQLYGRPRPPGNTMMSFFVTGVTSGVVTLQRSITSQDIRLYAPAQPQDFDTPAQYRDAVLKWHHARWAAFHPTVTEWVVALHPDDMARLRTLQGETYRYPTGTIYIGTPSADSPRFLPESEPERYMFMPRMSGRLNAFEPLPEVEEPSIGSLRDAMRYASSNPTAFMDAVSPPAATEQAKTACEAITRLMAAEAKISLVLAIRTVKRAAKETRRQAFLAEQTAALHSQSPPLQ